MHEMCLVTSAGLGETVNAPVFALQRMGKAWTTRFSAVVWALPMAAALSRVGAALLPGSFNLLAGLSGVTGWLALVLLAGAPVRIRLQPGLGHAVDSSARSEATS